MSVGVLHIYDQHENGLRISITLSNRMPHNCRFSEGCAINDILTFLLSLRLSLLPTRAVSNQVTMRVSASAATFFVMLSLPLGVAAQNPDNIFELFFQIIEWLLGLIGISFEDAANGAIQDGKW